MKRTKSIISLLLAVTMLFSFAACRKKPSDDTSSDWEYESDYYDDNSSTVSTDTSSESKTNQSSSGNAGSTASSGKKPTVSVPSGGGNTAKEIISKVPASLKNTTVNIYSWNEPGAVTTAESVIADFTKKTGIKVNWMTGTYINYATEITAMIAANNAPDIIRLRGFDPAVLSLMQPLSSSNFDFSGSVWDHDLMNYYTLNKKAYAVNVKNSLINQPMVLMYNRDLIGKFDLGDPYTLFKENKWTWSKFTELLNDFKSEAGSGYYAWSPFHYWEYTISVAGSDIIKFNGSKFSSDVNNAVYAKTLAVMSKMQSDGLLASKYANSSFNNGNILFMSDGIIGARRTHFYFTKLKETGSLGVVPLPKIDGQSTYYQVMSEYEAYGIAKGASNPGAVPYFLSYYLNADNYESNTFFNDATMLDVYKWCMSQKNKVQSYGHAASPKVVNDIYDPKAASSQIATKMQQNAPLVEKAVKELNDKLATIK